MTFWQKLFGRKMNSTAPSPSPLPREQAARPPGPSDASRGAARSEASSTASNRPSLQPLFVDVVALVQGRVDLAGVQERLRNGADPNERDSRAAAPIHLAALIGNEELACRVVTLLLQHKADVDARNGIGRTALHFAAENNKIALAKVLLIAGASPNARDQDGKSPLDIAGGELFDTIKTHSRQPLDTAGAGGEGDLSRFLGLLAVSGTQCSVFVHNIRNNGYQHLDGEMLDESHYAERYSNGRCSIRVATDPEDRLWFLSFRSENGTERIYFRDGKRGV